MLQYRSLADAVANLEAVPSELDLREDGELDLREDGEGSGAVGLAGAQIKVVKVPVLERVFFFETFE